MLLPLPPPSPPTYPLQLFPHRYSACDTGLSCALQSVSGLTATLCINGVSSLDVDR